MSLISDAFLGGVAGIGEAIGNLALKIREAITGKSILDSKDQIALLSLANEMDRLKLQADAALIQGQLEINKAEAASSSVWKGGWRPYIGWICGTAVAMAYIPRALVSVIFWGIQCWSVIQAGGSALPPYPSMDLSELMTILGGMLGFGILRTVERTKGKA